MSSGFLFFRKRLKGSPEAVGLLLEVVDRRQEAVDLVADRVAFLGEVVLAAQAVDLKAKVLVV